MKNLVIFVALLSLFIINTFRTSHNEAQIYCIKQWLHSKIKKMKTETKSADFLFVFILSQVFNETNDS